MKTKFLTIDLVVQGFLLSINTFLLLTILTIVDHGWPMVIFFLLTLGLGTYQWMFSAPVHLKVKASPLLSFRKIHFIGAGVYLPVAIAIVAFIPSQNDFLFVTCLIAIPQVIAYLYFFLTWSDYQKRV